MTTTTTPFRLPRLLTVKVAANYLGVCERTVRRLIKSGKLPIHRVGRQIRIAEDAVLVSLNGNHQ